MFVLVSSAHASKLAHAYQFNSWIIFFQTYFIFKFDLIWSWCFVLWSLCNPTRVALCEWGHVLCCCKQNQGSYPVKDALTEVQSWVLYIRVIVMCQNSVSWILCFSSSVLAGIVWKAMNSLVFYVFPVVGPLKSWMITVGGFCWVEMSPKQPSAYYFSILDVLLWLSQ